MKTIRHSVHARNTNISPKNITAQLLRRVLFALLLMCSFSFQFLSVHIFSVHAQNRQKITLSEQFIVSSYSVDDGLPTNLVKDIVQDKRGFTWLATDAGLVRFDGFRFQTITQNLPSQYVKRVFLRKNGQLLALTDMGLVEIHSQLDSVRISLLLGGSQTEQDKLLHYAKSIFEDAKGALWLSEKQALVRWSNGKFKRFLFPEKCGSTNVVLSFSVSEDGAGTVLASSFQGYCFRLNPQTDSFEEIVLPQNFGTFSKCLALKEKEFLIAAEKGLVRLSFDTSATKPRVEFRELVTGINKISAVSLVRTPSRSLPLKSAPMLIIGTWYGGVLLADTSLNTIKRVSAVEQQRIKGFAEDVSGNIWVCSDQGIAFMEQAMMRSVEGLDNATDVGMTVQARDGTIFTLGGEGLIAVNAASMQARSAWKKPDNVASLYALHADSRGGVWVGSLSGMLVYIQNGVVQKSYQINNGSTERGIFSLTEDKAGNVWGCIFYNRASVFCLEPNGTIRFFGAPQGLTTIGQVIRCTPEGTLYVGTSGNPQEYLFRYNPANDRFDNVSVPLKNVGNFKLNIYDLAQDSQNPQTLWLASSAGLLQVQGDSVSQPLNRSAEFMNLVGKSIAVDKYGSVWMGTDNGLLRYSPHQSSLSARAALLQQSSGLMSRTLSFRGLMLDNADNIWAATGNGLYALHIQAQIPETPRPVLVQANINGVKCSFQSLMESFPAESYIQLQFTVFAPSPQTSYFRHRIYLENGVKPEWSRPVQDPDWTLSPAESGTYILEIAARREGAGELWSKPLALRFSVQPPWFRTWWAFLLYALGASLLLGSLALAFIANRQRSRVAMEQQARVKLQEMVQHRTREITIQKELLESQTIEIQAANAELLRTNNELQHTNAALKEASDFKTRMISIVSHDLKNPLGSMLGFSKILESEVENTEHREMAHDMSNLSAQMLNLVKDLLDSAAMESGKMTVKKEPVDISEIVTAIVWQYRPIAEKKEQRISLSIEADCYVEGEQRRLWQVFENLISNAIKYSPLQKNIWITLEHCQSSAQKSNATKSNATKSNATKSNATKSDTTKSDVNNNLASSINTQCIRFSVRDEGPGFTPDDIKKAFGHFQKLSATPTGGETSSGVGLAIVKQITELHGGRVWIESALGQGASIIAEFPALNL